VQVDLSSVVASGMNARGLRSKTALLPEMEMTHGGSGLQRHGCFR